MPRTRVMSSDQKSVERLMASTKLSEASRKNYLMRVNQYLSEAKRTPDELVAWAKAKPRKFEESFIEFLRQAAKHSSPSTTVSFRDSVKRFLEINRATGIDWGYVNGFVPSAKKTGQDRAPTSDEVRRIIDVADLRTRCLVLFLSSSGARIGSVPYLKWHDVEEIEVRGSKMARLTIYRGEPEEYITFVTPECYRYWREYKGWRWNMGEKVMGGSNVFVTQGNTTKFNPHAIRPAAVKTLKNLLGTLLGNLEIRSAISKRKGYKNYEFKQVHGFRKFFKTRMEMSGIKPTTIEILMGNESRGPGSRVKPTDDGLLEEYSKAIDNLTIERGGARADLRNAFRDKLLLFAGFSQEEMSRISLSEISDEALKQIVRQKLLGENRARTPK